MIPFMIGFLISTLLVLYAFHFRVFSTGGSVTLITVATLIFGFAGPYAFIGLGLLFIPPSVIYALRNTEGPLLASRSIISFTIIPLYFSSLYFFMPSSTYLLYMVIGYSVAALDMWRRIAASTWSMQAYKLFRFKRTDVDTPGSLSGFGALAAVSATALFLGYTVFLVPGNDHLLLVLLANVFMYLFLLLFGLLKRSYLTRRMKILQTGKTLQFDEPMLRFLAASFSVIVISTIVSLSI